MNDDGDDYDGDEPDDDLPLFHARNSDPDSSHQSMGKMDRQRMSEAMNLTVELHRKHGPMTDFEFWPLFYAARGRVREPGEHYHQEARSKARDNGFIRDTGTKRRDPRTKRDVIVWEACNIPPPEIVRCPTCGGVTRRKAQLRRIYEG